MKFLSADAHSFTTSQQSTFHCKHINSANSCHQINTVDKARPHIKASNNHDNNRVKNLCQKPELRKDEAPVL